MIALWLLPAAGDREVLASLVARIATEFDAAHFTPHVTLLAGAMELGRASKCLHELVPPEPLRLEVDSVRASEAFTKSVFIQFRHSTAASRLAADIREALGGASDYVFDPHLSLLYTTMPLPEKEAIARRTALRFRSVTFDAVRMITGAAQTASREDVESWRTIGEKQFIRA